MKPESKEDGAVSLFAWWERRRQRRRARIYEGPSPEIDGGTRIRRDTSAPKEIVSEELLRFFCRFSTLSLIDEEGLLPGVYSFGASKEAEGVVCTADCTNPQVLRGERRDVRTEAFLAELDALLRRYDVARYNGQYYKVSGLPDFFGVTVDAAYASGETLYCYNNQDPFLSPAMVGELCRLYGIGQEEET